MAKHFRDIVESILSPPPPSDPLYLSHRTLAQKLKLWALIAAPCLLAAGILFFGLSGWIHPGDSGIPAAELPTSARRAIPIESNHEVEVVEATVSGAKLAGIVRNNTDRAIRTADIVFNLTDSNGSQLGAVSARVENLAPRTSTRFELAVPQQDAAFALVRDIHTQ